ncbi:hypothetical protein P691DRAFT_304903 [Macrolepiota fuliginosa MF-IS2]|uniref:Uncharacterized protein n=1 Tax=Macrolepiota fuliginosa MF-IS2 TaxID=1400762 RepID=A0A9P6C0Q7_9AGAR|nr:hypothetical protein P691DRAFT_304903 [Macrolepiota fuliginosa MF-IS2]
MSAGGFDATHPAPTYQRYEPRRSSGTFTAPNYNRSFNHPPRRRTPSPGASRRFSYDSYTPNRVDPLYRNEHSNPYRPNIYRPDYPATNFWERSPTPDSYSYTPRSQDSDTRDRANTWHAPVKSQSSWQDRKPIPSSPVRDRPRRDDTMATRIFEPSDSWKRDHNDRPGRSDGASLVDRHPPNRRENTDISPDRPPRTGRGFPPPTSADRYRPLQEPFRDTRSDYDSYRPPYDDPWSKPTPHEPISAPIHRRAPSGSYQKRGQLGIGASGPSASPKMFHRFPGRRNRGFSQSFNQDRSSYSNDHMHYGGELSHMDYADHGDEDAYRPRTPPSRPSSRSSIASTVPSEKQDTSSYSTVAVIQGQMASSQDTLETSKPSMDLPKSPVNRASSPYPSGPQSLDDAKPVAPAEDDTEDVCPVPFRAGSKEDDITEEAEVNEILSQSKLVDRVVWFYFVISCNRSITDGSSS